jgi:hypothetical protein
MNVRILLGAFLLAPACALLASLPGADSPSRLRVSTPLPAMPPKPAAPRRMIFGVGVGFEPAGAAQGARLSTVLPNSPASRAGLVPGCIVTEINGEITVGRAGDDCARAIRDAFGPVRIKYLDPALREKTLTLEKAWLTLPE